MLQKESKTAQSKLYVFWVYVSIKMFASALRWTVWEVQVYQKSVYFMASVIPRKKIQELM